MDGRRGAGGAAGVRTIEGDISLNDDGGQRAGHYADGAFPWRLRVVPQISLKQHDLIVVHFQRKLGVRCNGPCGRGHLLLTGTNAECSAMSLPTGSRSTGCVSSSLT